MAARKGCAGQERGRSAFFGHWQHERNRYVVNLIMTPIHCFHRADNAVNASLRAVLPPASRAEGGLSVVSDPDSRLHIKKGSTWLQGSVGFPQSGYGGRKGKAKSKKA